jgi:hypothetical protein
MGSKMFMLSNGSFLAASIAMLIGTAVFMYKK